MKKVSIFLATMSMALIGCVNQGPITTYVNSTGGYVETSHTYTITQSKATIEVGGTLILQISCDGTVFDSATWSSNDTSVATVTKNGLVTGISEGTCQIAGKCDSKTTLYCNLTVSKSGTVTPPGPVITDTPVHKLFMNNGDKGADNTYYFFSAKTGAYPTFYIYDFTFAIDVTTDECFIKSVLNGTSDSGKKFKFYGVCSFSWNSFKYGTFYGGYTQETSSGSTAEYQIEIDAEPDNPNYGLVFRNDKTIVTGYECNYRIVKNDFSSKVTSDDAMSVIARIEECASFAKEVFEKHNSSLSLW